MDIDPARGKLLAALTIAAVERHAGDAVLIDDQDNLRELRMLRAGSVVLVEHPATSSSPRHINGYVNGYAVEAAEPSFKIGPSRLLYVLIWQHRATPPNFHLQLIKANARTWAPVVVATLVTELRARSASFDNMDFTLNP